MLKNKLKRQYYKFLIRKISRSIWDMELRVVTIKQIKEGIRIEFDKLSANIKGFEDEVTKEKAKDKIDMEKIKKLEKFKAIREVDAEKLQEQMIGKWIKEEQSYHGGIDQEVKVVEKKIEGGISYRELIEKELKKI